MIAFFWGMALLWLKVRKAQAQAAALKALVQYDLSEVEFGVGTASHAQEWLKKIAERPQDFMLLNRLQSAFAALANLRQATSLPGIVNNHAEADEAHVEESYSFITMLLYAIPVLGFIGTVLGLGEAIGGFGATLSQGTENMDGLISSLKDVAGGLAVAFDTTLLALIGALAMQIYASFVRARETDFLDDCHTFFQNEFFPRLRIHDSGEGSQPSAVTAPVKR
jgi:biopolymer transport protein ExbB/TolQ